MQKWKVGDDAVAWTTKDGDWVPAEVAQGLYDALRNLSDAACCLNLDASGHVLNAINAADKALAAADGEEV